MRLRLRYAVAIALCACALAVTVSAKWIAAHEDALAEAEVRADAAARTVGEVLSLRGLKERSSLRARPPQDLTARLNETLKSSGAGTGLLSEVAAHGGAAAGSGDGKYALQQMRVSLKGAKLSDLGKFIEHWRATQPLWAVTSVDLSRTQQVATPGAKAPHDERFNATIVLTSSYVSARRTGSQTP